MSNASGQPPSTIVEPKMLSRRPPSPAAGGLSPLRPQQIAARGAPPLPPAPTPRRARTAPRRMRASAPSNAPRAAAGPPGVVPPGAQAGAAQPQSPLQLQSPLQGVGPQEGAEGGGGRGGTRGEELPAHAGRAPRGDAGGSEAERGDGGSASARLQRPLPPTPPVTGTGADAPVEVAPLSGGRFAFQVIDFAHVRTGKVGAPRPSAARGARGSRRGPDGRRRADRYSGRVRSARCPPPLLLPPPVSLQYTHSLAGAARGVVGHASRRQDAPAGRRRAAARHRRRPRHQGQRPRGVPGPRPPPPTARRPPRVPQPAPALVLNPTPHLPPVRAVRAGAAVGALASQARPLPRRLPCPGARSPPRAPHRSPPLLLLL